MASMTSASGQKLSREDWRKEKELEEARKAGNAPALQDEEGKDINPHIPQYISAAPWYFNAQGPTLKHQRPQDEKQQLFNQIGDWYKKGIKEGPVATKFKKGACENCGSMTHKKKDCLERPRRIGARFTGEDIAPDEYIQSQLSFDYDGKRDRWNGYNMDEHHKIVDEYTKLEMAKQKLKAERLEADLMEGMKPSDKTKVVESDDEDEEDEDIYAEELDMPGQKFDSKRRTTVRNLRIREDTAKYLYNLDPNSSYYDPKTRSMRQDPLKDMNDKRITTFHGDNFVRFSGDTHKMAQTQMFAWQAYEKGSDVHLQADPTKLELLNKEFQDKKDHLKNRHKNSVLEKYGGEEHLQIPSKDLLLAQTEQYVEYSRTGGVVKGQEKAVAKSKYEEDVYLQNHTNVWGSYWEEGRWGYGCCHSFIKNSYCTGEAGKRSAKMRLIPLTDAAKAIQQATDSGKTLVELHQETAKPGKKRSRKSEEEDDEEAKKEKLKKALEAEDKHQKYVDKIMKMDERKRPYNSMRGDYHEVTDEDLEAYRLKRRDEDDPMKAFMKK